MRFLFALLALLVATPAVAQGKRPPADIQRIIDKDARDESLTPEESKKLQAWEDAQEAEEERAMEAMERGLLESVEAVAPPEVLQELKFQCPAKLPPLSPRPPSPAEWTALLDRVSGDASAKLGEAGPKLARATASKSARDSRVAGAVLGSLYSVSAGIVVTAGSCKKEPTVHCAANLATMLDGIEDDAGAATALAWALQKAPKHPLPLTNLAWLQFHRGDFPGAKARFEGVERLLGPNRFTDLGIGLSEFCLGHPTAARTRLRRVRLPPSARQALEEEDNRTVQRRNKPDKSSEDEQEEDEGEPDPTEPPPAPLERSRAQRPELPEPPIAANTRLAAGSAKAKLEQMTEWGEEMRSLKQAAAGYRPPADLVGTRTEGSKLILTLDDDGADDAAERVRDYYRKRYWAIVHARDRALEPVRKAAKERIEPKRAAMGRCLQMGDGAAACARQVCLSAAPIREAALNELVAAWRPHHDKLLTLIGDYGQVSSEAVSLAHTAAHRAALDANRQWQVLNWLHADWSSAVSVEAYAAQQRVELCPDVIPDPPRTKRKVVQKPAKPGCPDSLNGPMVGASVGVVSVKANCSKLEFGINFEGFTGSIGHDRTTQTTSLFLGVGAEAGALNRLDPSIPGASEVDQRAVVGGKAGFFIESTGGHISDFGVRATGGTGAVGAEATVGFGARGAVDGFLDARDSGASTGGMIEAAVVGGCQFQSSVGATVGPLSLEAPL